MTNFEEEYPGTNICIYIYIFFFLIELISHFSYCAFDTSYETEFVAKKKYVSVKEYNINKTP